MTNWIGGGAPPTVTVTAWMGFGRAAIAVPDAGADPVATAGDTAPAPAMNRVTIWPRAALVSGTGAPLESVKIPGAAAVTAKDLEALCPLLLTVRVATAFGGVW